MQKERGVVFFSKGEEGGEGGRCSIKCLCQDKTVWASGSGCSVFYNASWHHQGVCTCDLMNLRT